MTRRWRARHSNGIVTYLDTVILPTEAKAKDIVYIYDAQEDEYKYLGKLNNMDCWVTRKFPHRQGADWAGAMGFVTGDTAYE